ncbi:MAG: hypothetical protein CMJ55_03050 [Planctomycetaceae bacterium]|nr:hypothetical protein [Planctomycetaceae bacterium]
MAKQYPGTRGFAQTLLSCGTNGRNIEDFLHSLSWEKKLSPFYQKDLAYTYFSDPSIFFLILNKFWADDAGNPPGENIFALFIRFIIRGIRLAGDTDVDSQGERDIPYVLSATQALTAYYTASGLIPPSISVDTTVAAERPLVNARKRFLADMLKYAKHVASWPLNEDTTLFGEWRQMITDFKVVRNSEEEQQFIEVYKTLESKLATLTSFMMSGKGLAPMPLYFGDVNPPAQGVNPDVISQEDYESTLERTEQEYLEAFSLQKQAEFSESEAEILRTRTVAGQRYEAYQIARSNVPWLPWPEGQYFEGETPGTIDRWYAWAAQFWLKSNHDTWFRQLAKLSRTDETASLFRSTQIVVLDDSSAGCSRFGRYGLNTLNMPHLIYVYTIRNESPWWRPPELGWDELETDAAVAVEKIMDESQRFEVWKERLNALKVSLDEGLVLENGNVVIYTTSPEIIGYCLVNSVNVIIYNNWLADRPIQIKSLREQVLRQRALLGRVVTPLLPESTIILTFVVLLAVSCSSGIPMYVGFGWNNVFSQWVNLVREYQKLVKPDRNNPYSTCAWLARRGIDERIIINRSLLIPLISRVLHSKFASDKPVTKLMSAYNIWSTKYKDLINENRIGTGRVEPIPILKMWRPYTNELYEGNERQTDQYKREIKAAEARENEEQRIKEYEALRESWQQRRDEFNAKQLQDYNGRQERYRTEIAVPQVEGSILRGEDYDNRLQEVNDTIAQKQELQEKLADEIRKLEGEENDFKTRADAALIELNDTIKAKNLYDEQGSTFGSLGAYIGSGPERVTQSDVDVKQERYDALKNSVSLVQLEIGRKESSLKLAIAAYDEARNSRDIILSKPRPEPDDIDDIMDRWKAANPPNYQEFGEDEPQLPELLEEVVGDDEMNFLNVIAGVELNAKEDNYEVDSDAEADEVALKANKDIINEQLDAASQKWAESYEWMYAQRQMFQDKYYAPLDFDELLTRFRIRLRDWTGASIITINT